jgi:3-methyladenine DNA glycosylase/8-oxoguanine DNA glycosylase
MPAFAWRIWQPVGGRWVVAAAPYGHGEPGPVTVDSFASDSVAGLPAHWAGGFGQDQAGGAAEVGAASGLGLELCWQAPFPLDLRQTMIVHRFGPRDPSFRIDRMGVIWRASLTPEGPATLRLAARPGLAAGAPAADCAEPAGDGPAVEAVAWGPGARWLLAAVPDLLGARDRPETFRPVHQRLRELAGRHAGFRVGRTGRVLEALVPAVLGQKVVTEEAFRAWRLLLLRFGLPAPGPLPWAMRVCPPPATWAAIPAWDWHLAGVEGVRARTIANAAMVASRLEEICGMPAATADDRLRSLPGIGPWTSAEVRQRACGDADAVSIGDYHLPGLVGWTLAGQTTDDAGMLELLAAYSGHRYRVTRLVEIGGAGPPRRGPKAAVRDYRAI